MALVEARAAAVQQRNGGLRRPSAWHRRADGEPAPPASVSPAGIPPLCHPPADRGSFIPACRGIGFARAVEASDLPAIEARMRQYHSGFPGLARGRSGHLYGPPPLSISNRRTRETAPRSATTCSPRRSGAMRWSAPAIAASAPHPGAWNSFRNRGRRSATGLSDLPADLWRRTHPRNGRESTREADRRGLQPVSAQVTFSTTLSNCVSAQAEIAFSVFDGETTDEADLLYRSGAQRNRPGHRASRRAGDPDRATAPWTLQIETTPSFAGRFPPAPLSPWLMGIGFFATLLLGLATLGQARATGGSRGGPIPPSKI